MWKLHRLPAARASESRPALRGHSQSRVALHNDWPAHALPQGLRHLHFGFEDFQTASIDDCTTRWRDVIAAFDYPPSMQEDMTTRAAQASCMAASDVQHNAQGHTTSDDHRAGWWTS